jgi:glycosyltransferase involved in cell wall biosynthesis
MATTDPPISRVLQVCEPTHSGAALVTFRLARGLRADGVQAVVCTPEGQLSDWCTEQGIPVARLPFARRAPRSYIRAIRVIRRLVREGDYTIIHAHSSFSGLLVRIARTSTFPPIVFQPHAWSFLAVRPALRGPLKLVERVLARRTDLLICVSEEEMALARAARIRPRRETVIPNGVPFEASPRSRSKLPARPRGGCMTRLVEQKGVDVLVRAAATPDWPAELVVEVLGTGPQAQELQTLSERLGVTGRVHFLGYSDDVQAHLQRWDLFVLPSRYEGAPLALLEALAAGLVVITTRVAGVTGLVDEYWTVPIEDPAGLARALARALGDWPRARRDAAAARRRASESNSLTTQLERVLAAYQNLL